MGGPTLFTVFNDQHARQAGDEKAQYKGQQNVGMKEGTRADPSPIRKHAGDSGCADPLDYQQPTVEKIGGTK